MSHEFPTTPPAPGGGVPQYSGSMNTYSSDRMAADKAAQLSLIFGIVGLFIAGIIFGPLAIWQASKAEKMNKAATPGKVLGWIGTLWGIGQIILFFVVAGSLFAASASYGL